MGSLQVARAVIEHVIFLHQPLEQLGLQVCTIVPAVEAGSVESRQPAWSLWDLRSPFSPLASRLHPRHQEAWPSASAWLPSFATHRFHRRPVSRCCARHLLSSGPTRAVPSPRRVPEPGALLLLCYGSRPHGHRRMLLRPRPIQTLQPPLFS